MTAETLGSRMMNARLDRLSGNAGGVDPSPPLPAYIRFMLARLRLLHDIPFRYLVPDARLLPNEALRFFTLNDSWLDQLVEGALNGASNGSRERARAKAAAGRALASSTQLRYGVRKVALRRASFELAIAEAGDVRPGTVSGMLIRSRLVADWPRLGVRAWFSADPTRVPPGADAEKLEREHPELVVPILRFEHLDPAILLVLFDGIPELVWLEEPHSAVQFGVEADQGVHRIDLRDEAGQATPATVAVPMRGGALSGVVDIAQLAAAIDGERPLAHARGSAALALQLLRAPARQRFVA